APSTLSLHDALPICHVELRLVRQQHLQSRVLVAEKRLAFHFTLVTEEGGRGGNSLTCFVELLKNQQTQGRRAAVLDLHVLPRRRSEEHTSELQSLAY